LTVELKDIGKFNGQEVTVRGWMYNKRSSGGINFLQIRDGSGFIQGTVVKGEVTEEVFDLAGRLTIESSIIITGSVRQDKRAPSGFEILVKDIQLVQLAEEYPLQKKEHGVDFLFSHRHLHLRSESQWVILRVRAAVIRACIDFLEERGFVRIDSPLLTPTSCEGTSTLFQTDYFGDPAYLSQSGQLYSEAAIMSFGKVYCFGPTFRAEKSKTRRHIMEFWMLEPEMAWYDLEENMALQEELVMHILREVLAKHGDELKDKLKRDTGKLSAIKEPFPRITYDQAMDKLAELGCRRKYEDGIGAEEETKLSKEYSSPLFITHFPTEQKAFYMKRDRDNPKLTLSNDMLAPEGYGEIIGGSVREENLELLEEMRKLYDIPAEPLAWYYDLRRYGSVPHSGFGMGLERVVAWLCGLHHVREAAPWPRTLTRIYP
jgi:asparaginyl-tRNA synthetase